MDSSALISIIRKQLPALIAKDIVGVQPMQFADIDSPASIETGENFSYDQPYWVELNLNGLFSSRQKKYTEVHAWVNKTFGWNNSRWSASNRKYWFKNEKDRMLFVLKWSS